MAEGVIGRNLTFPIKNADGTSFHGLSLKKATYNTIVMSLGDKITGDVYYNDNTLAVTMQEYIEYTDNGTTVKFYLVNPPTIVKERMVGDNNELKGMTKYSFEFYHPMYMLGNFPFTDIAVTSNQQKYLSQNKTFSWIGTLVDYVAKLNKNLQGTQWKVVIGNSVSSEDKNKMSEVMSFDKQTIAEALKKGYEIWEIPYVVDVVKSGEEGYSEGKRFKVQFGLPTTEILVNDGQGNQVPYVFRCGQGVGLKNNSRTPRNNKIVTRIAGYGSETNIQYGYPQIIWTGNQSWDYTINNSSSAANSYPIYDGIVNGQKVRLIKHPFTRTTLMPSIYRDTVNKKVNPFATGYDPTIEIKDYYDADNTYENPIVADSPCYEIHEFDKIKPELTNKQLLHVEPANQQETSSDFRLMSSFLPWLEKLATQTNIGIERAVLHEMYEQIQTASSWSEDNDDSQYWFKASFTKDSNYAYVKYESSNINFTATVQYSATVTPDWDDSMDDDGNYKQSYFKVSLPQFDFDLYACAAVTQEMKIYMRSGDCLGCTFTVMVDWDDYKANFYDEDGNFAPNGSQRDLTKYPNTINNQVTLLLQKDIETFGRLMPNIYQTPESGDKFVILGISLPQSYITSAESRLDADMKQYMRDNNVYYFDYPLKFDEYFLATRTDILSQMRNNVVVRFSYGVTAYALYIKQMTIKFGQSTLPQYDITLTDDVEIVLNQIGQVTNEVSNLRLLLGGGYGDGGSTEGDDRYLRKDVDDTASGFITFMKGLQVGERFVTGLLGEGGVFRRESDGTTYIEADKLYIRMKAYFDTVEVRKYMHSGGNRIASLAGMNCTRVEYIDSNGDVTTDIEETVAFKCYFRAQDDSRTITNDFIVGDLAYCKETNVYTDNVEQHGFWRLVTSKSDSANDDDEHWIMLSNRQSETIIIGGRSYTHSGYQSGSDAPLAYDDIIQLGNIYDNTRQGVIVEFVGGADAPSYQIFQGIDSFSLVGKNYVRFGYDSQSGGAQAYIGNPDGSTYIWYHNVNNTPQLDVKANVKFTSPYTQQETDLNAFAAAVKANEDYLQSQIDGEIDTWFYEGTPTLSNMPAVDWNTVSLKERHLGDLYYDIGTGQTAGFAYRFVKTTSGGVDTYSWQYIEDTAIAEALAMAAHAQDTADHKRRVFLNTPAPPYDAGDLWVNAVWPASGASQGETYNDDILRCLTSKDSTESFSINDWGLASRYTDDTALQTFLEGEYLSDKNNLQNQIDGKAETWYQASDPSSSWTTNELKEQHLGDLWYNTSPDSHKTFIWNKTVSGSSATYTWEEENVPIEVFDMIDGKSSIFTSRPSSYKKNDLWILASDMTINGTAYKKGEVLTATTDSTTFYASHWTKKVCYTDDTRINNFVNEILNGTGALGNDKIVADAIRAVNGALNEDTQIVGGLILTSLISLKSNGNTYAGISGQYNSSAFGGGIAAWYGGGMVDRYNSSTGTFGSSGAKSLFRFDGSGYVAKGNIYWDESGVVTIQGTTIDATYLKKGGNSVATEGDLANYVTLATDQTITGTKTFQNRIKIGDIYIGYDSTNDAIEVYKLSGSTHVAADFYATGGVSALGITSGGGGGGASLNQPLSGINSAGLSSPSSAGLGLVFNGSAWVYTNAASMSVYGLTVSSTLQAYNAIFGSTVSGAAFSATGGGFSVSGKDNTYILLAGGGTKLLSEIGGGGAVNSITLGQGGTNYTPDSNGIVTLPPYPSGTVTSVSYNNGTPITPVSGTVSLGSLCVKVKLGTTDYTVSSAGVISLPAYPSTSGLVSSVVIGANGTPISPVNGVVTLPAYPSKTSDLTNDSGFITGYTDTKNTAGATDNVNTKLFLVGSTSQGANPQTYTNQSCYIGSDNCLYSGGSKVMTAASGYLPLTGGTLTGELMINASKYDSSNNSSLLDIVNNYAIQDWQKSIFCKWPNMQSGGKATMEVGVNNKAKNLAYIAFYYAGAASNNNKVMLGVHSVDGQFFLNAAGNIGIGMGIEGVPSYKVHVVGSVFASSFIKSGGTSTQFLKADGSVDSTSYATSDTKNTAGATQNTAISLYLVGAPSQSQNPETYTRSGCYISSDGYLYSGGSKVLTSSSGLVSGISVDNSNPYEPVNGIVGLPVLRLTGGSLTGKLSVSIDGSGGNKAPIASSVTTTYNGFNWCYEGLVPNLTVNSHSVMIIGKAESGYNMAHFGFCYKGSGSTSNYASIGLWDKDDILVATGNGYVGIGTTTPSYKLDVSGTLHASDEVHLDGKTFIGTGVSGNYKLLVNGSIICTSVTQTSDVRNKDIIADKTIELWQVAQAPIFTFTWKDKELGFDTHVGTSAQYWKSIVPEAVQQSGNGYLGMQYDVVALLAAVTTAKKVQDHETRIQTLERENAALRNELNQLKTA